MDTSILKTFESDSDAATEQFAEKLAGMVPRGTVIALHGNLGAGKTVFARGFARGLGLDEQVSSPTYTIIQEYKLPDCGYLYHMDLYRIADSASALGFGIDEFLNDRNSYALIEWPERIEDILPPETLHLTITRTGEESRTLKFENR
ncbi:MAG: tRNA (adenosine(37)-N6)-threonylcarbamoyltransferase complex ATPase subunit type 1 TsaE [Victivallaceae bacterium]|nr:tRNA (adenosine(37)-N6)-threonylcarbamoyltransferase complex ATPase subunit type 1 TsaE [Victivallaceae bacterium]